LKLIILYFVHYYANSGMLLTLSLHKKSDAEASRVVYKARTEYFMD